MNKQEFLSELNKLLENVDGYDLEESYENGLVLAIKEIISIAEQLDEPQKVVIPKSVAEWIEVNQGLGISFASALLFEIRENYKSVVNDWLHDKVEGVYSDELSLTLLRAWLDGYEVESEQLYTVEIPDPHNFTWKYTVLVKTPTNNVYVNNTDQDNWKEMEYYQLTEEEIKQDFEWAWAAGFPKEVK